MISLLFCSVDQQHYGPEKGLRAPFTKDRDGFVIAEGAATLVLPNRSETALKRGAAARPVGSAAAESVASAARRRPNDFQPQNPRRIPSPRGRAGAHRAIATIRAALEDAGLSADEIGYINAHGTSTPENDKMEYLSLSTVFGERMAHVPVSSNKSMIGHTLTAAGAVEAVFSLLTMSTGTLPPTINYDNPDPAIPLDVVPNVKRDATVTSVLSQLLRLWRTERMPCHVG